MKRLAVFAALCLFVPVFLSGCLKGDADMKISEDGSCVFRSTLNVEKDAVLAVIADALNNMDGGAGFSNDAVEALLEQSGYVPHEIDGVQYYDISDMAMQNPYEYGSIDDFYWDNFDTSKAMAKEDGKNVFSISETSAVIKISKEAAIGGERALELYRTFMAAALELDSPDDLVIKDEDAIYESLKTAMVVFSVTFPSKISEASSGAAVSEDKKTMTAKYPLASEEDFYEYAICENDIGAKGAYNGAIYDGAAVISLPDGALASVNGKEADGGEIECAESGIYTIKLSDASGTSETMFFAVDSQAPAIRKKDGKNSAPKSLYEKNEDEALLAKGYLCFYDEVCGIDSVKIDGKDALPDAQAVESSQIDPETGKKKYLEPKYLYAVNSLEEGEHEIEAADILGNETTVDIIVDRTKPAIKGVKNGRTYKRAVKIRFSDKNGIKSAKLNAKSVKSGARVKKKGRYVLKVVDAAGNSKTVKFRIRK